MDLRQQLALFGLDWTELPNAELPFRIFRPIAPTQWIAGFATLDALTDYVAMLYH